MNKKDSLIFPQRNSIDEGFEVTPFADGCSIEITDDWYGDTETGFGASLSFDLDKEQIKKLIDFLGRIE